MRTYKVGAAIVTFWDGLHQKMVYQKFPIHHEANAETIRLLNEDAIEFGDPNPVASGIALVVGWLRQPDMLPDLGYLPAYLSAIAELNGDCRFLLIQTTPDGHSFTHVVSARSPAHFKKKTDAALNKAAREHAPGLPQEMQDMIERGPASPADFAPETFQRT